jgi:crossover junction endodeoxyribonuclease RuvC
MRILGIDPGYERVGFAIVEKQPQDKTEKLIFSECFTTSKDLPFPSRIYAIGNEMERLIKKYNPKVCALEKLYFFKNQKTAMTVSEARGVLLFIAEKQKLKIFEYTPLQIKSAVTGNGHSDKNQVINMVTKLVKIKEPIRHDDEYDAIATGLTCLACEAHNL